MTTVRKYENFFAGHQEDAVVVCRAGNGEAGLAEGHVPQERRRHGDAALVRPKGVTALVLALI